MSTFKRQPNPLPRRRQTRKMSPCPAENTPVAEKPPMPLKPPKPAKPTEPVNLVGNQQSSIDSLPSYLIL